MKNYKMTLEYDGSRYGGWQRLGKNETTNTIENKICEVLKKLTHEDIILNCGSRTESGVHAYEQTVNFKTASAASPLEIKRYLNRYLPMDIAVLDITEKPERFHASLNALSKTYLYRIAIGETPSVFDRKYTYYSFKKPDVALMKEGASILIGRHDFKKFSTAKKNKSTVKEITSIDIYADTKEIQISITANDFLHNMARMIISTLLDVGIHNRPVSDISAILDLKSPVESSAPADSCGMFLERIEY